VDLFENVSARDISLTKAEGLFASRMGQGRQNVANPVTQEGQLARAMTVRTTRNDSLTPELDAFVDAHVISGQDRTASEVFRAAGRRDER